MVDRHAVLKDFKLVHLVRRADHDSAQGIPEAGDPFLCLASEDEEGRRERVAVGRRGAGDGGEQGAFDRMTGARVDHMAVGCALHHKGFAPHGRDRQGFVFQGDDGQHVVVNRGVCVSVRIG